MVELRRGFTEKILSKHVHETEASVDKLFQESSCAEVSNILKTIGKKNDESKLSSQFDGAMTLGGPES